MLSKRNNFIYKHLNSMVAAGLIVISTNTMAAPVVSIEAPEENATITGIIQVFGWAIDEHEIDSVEMRIDGADQGIQIGSGGERSDVKAAYPDMPDADHSGFSTALSANLLSNGPHTIEIHAINKNGETTVVSRQVKVSNPPGQQSARDQLDISDATARISGQQIFLDDVLLNGRNYSNLELSFDATTNAFQITTFADDLDGDGYHDDDHDQDGFHDDDKDRNGIRDYEEDKDEDDGEDDNDNENHEPNNQIPQDTPDPITPAPETPEPVTPDPVAPTPVTPTPVIPDPVVPTADASKGKQLYATCIACHGADPAQNMSNILSGKDANATTRAIHKNKGGMGFLSNVLSPVDIEDIAAYLQQF